MVELLLLGMEIYFFLIHTQQLSILFFFKVDQSLPVVAGAQSSPKELPLYFFAFGLEGGFFCLEFGVGSLQINETALQFSSMQPLARSVN
jgi:hypothetical protein